MTGITARDPITGRQLPAPVVDGKKQCRLCWEWKPTDGGFHPKTFDANRNPKTWQAYCVPCQRQRNRELYRHKPRQPAKTARMTREEFLAQRRADYAARMEALRADPERLAKHRADERIAAAFYRQRKGAKPTNRPRRKFNGEPVLGAWRPSAAANGDADVVPAGPFVEWVRETFGGLAIPDIAAQLRISERRVRGLLEGWETRVMLTTVDKAVTKGVGRPDLLQDLYPLVA